MNRWALIGGLFAMGCGGGSAPRFEPANNVVPVSGLLTYQGKPLPYFQLTFMSKDGSTHTAGGRTDASGNFILGTNIPGDGASVGKYLIGAVFVGAPEEDNSASKVFSSEPEVLPKPTIQIPTKYNNPKTSFVEVDVPAGGLVNYKLDLQ